MVDPAAKRDVTCSTDPEFLSSTQPLPSVQEGVNLFELSVCLQLVPPKGCCGWLANSPHLVSAPDSSVIGVLILSQLPSQS